MIQPSSDRAWRLRQLIVGLVALPLSIMPFVAYATMTPEGRLVADRAVVTVAPPGLPLLSPSQRAAARAAAPQYGNAVMVLAYHGIQSGSDAEGGFVVSPARFADHLATLRAAGMHAVTARQVAAAFAGGRPLPANAVMITFDDGRTDAMLFADPLLKQAHMAATMFVITGAASKPGVYYAPWKRIESYAHNGRWDIESHTASSHHMQTAGVDGEQLPALTSLAKGETLADYRRRVHADLGAASAAIAAHTGRAPVAFAYPFGAYGVDRTNNPQVRDILRKEVAGRYQLAFHQDDQAEIPLATAADDHLGLRRLEVGDWSGRQLLRRIHDAAGRTSTRTVPLPGTGLPESPTTLLPLPLPAAEGAGQHPDLPTRPSVRRPSVTVPVATVPVVVPSFPTIVTTPVLPVASPVAFVPPPTTTTTVPTSTTTTAPSTTTTTSTTVPSSPGHGHGRGVNPSP